MVIWSRDERTVLWVFGLVEQITADQSRIEEWRQRGGGVRFIYKNGCLDVRS